MITEQQQKALFLWFEQMAEGLNNTDASLQKVCTLPIELTKDNFRKNIWDAVQVSLYPDTVTDKGRPTTKKLSTTQLQDVYEQVNKIIGERWGVSAPFPSEEEL